MFTHRWSTIARYLPGRTDNEIKNYWRTHFKKTGKPSEKNYKRKFLKQKVRQEESGISAKVSPQFVTINQNISPELQGQQEIQSTLKPNMENPQFPVMYPEVDPWSDTKIPMDGLWGWLWNIGDQNGKGVQANIDCSKMANQNHAAFAP